MAKNPSKEKVVLKKGAWSLEEDEKLISYISRFGIWNWSEIPKQAGLARTSKSCRLRWVNYLKPGIKRGNISKEEEETIVKLHNILGNRWAAIAAKLPQRTDNEIKNFWKTRKKKHKDFSSSKTESSAESDNKSVGEAQQQENGISQIDSSPKMGETQHSNTDDFSPLSSSQAVRIESLLDIEDYIGLSETSTSNEAQTVLLDEVSYPTEVYSPLELYDSYYDPSYDFWSSPFI